MPSYRRDRIDEEVAKVLSDILRTVKDYRITGSFVSITRVAVAPDLSTARVFFSAIGGNCEPKEIRKGLISASGYMRTQLAKIMNLRQTPKLEFVYDSSMENGSHIHTLLKQVEEELAASEQREKEREAEMEEFYTRVFAAEQRERAELEEEYAFQAFVERLKSEYENPPKESDDE